MRTAAAVSPARTVPAPQTPALGVRSTSWYSGLVGVCWRRGCMLVVPVVRSGVPAGSQVAVQRRRCAYAGGGKKSRSPNPASTATPPMTPPTVWAIGVFFLLEVVEPLSLSLSLSLVVGSGASEPVPEEVSES